MPTRQTKVLRSRWPSASVVEIGEARRHFAFSPAVVLLWVRTSVQESPVYRAEVAGVPTSLSARIAGGRLGRNPVAIGWWTSA